MDIRKEIKDTAKLVAENRLGIYDYAIGANVLTILKELNERQSIVGNVISELQRVLDNNPLKPNWPDSPKEELKPCPCCSNKHISIYYNQDEDKTKYYCCNNCGIRTVDLTTEREAREIWQRRSNA